MFESRLPYTAVSWQSGYCEVLLILYFRGSIPLDAYKSNNLLLPQPAEGRGGYNEHVEIGKQSPLKQEWK